VTGVHYYAPANVADVVRRASEQSGTTDLVTIFRFSAGMDARRAA
jgi:hypothetical protein